MIDQRVAGVCLGVVFAAVAAAQPRVLFVRGAERSGGFFEAGNDAGLTEQLADINNTATGGGNHGWFEFAEALRADGFVVEQIIEPLEVGAPSTGQTDGAPIAFESIDLSVYDALVFGSNNAVYPSASVDAVEAYVRTGGAAMFISDANFGSDWPDASTSDQFFLDRFGWVMQQDRGTYRLGRADGDFLEPDAAILANVDDIDGEGVSPIVVPTTDLPGVESLLVVRANPGSQTRNNDSTSGQGSSRPVGPQDAALAVAFVECGRIAGHYDRNTFFNLNGAGTSINRFDNMAYAVQLVRWLAIDPADITSEGVCDATGAASAVDGAVTLSDFGCYLSEWSNNTVAADITTDGACQPGFGGDGVTLSDFSCYLSRWAQSCP
ncbi:MAG: GC-type dockerin domain-anchored protein [Planctomycetota bacterium]